MKAEWEVKTLGEVCKFDKLQAIHKNLPYVGLEDIESNTALFIGSFEPQSVKSATFKFNNSHILYGRLRPYLNKVLAPEFDGHCSTEIFPIKPKASLLREYLLYWFIREQTVDRINATCTGARMPRADMNEVLNFEFALPPITEQQRIVAILDQAFEGIAKARANAEQNLQNARALFESHLQSVFTQDGDEWRQVRLKDIADYFNGLTYSPDNVKDSGTVVLRSSNIQDDELDFSDIVRVDSIIKDKLYVQDGDILMCSRNGSKRLVGKTATISNLKEKMTFGTFMMVIRSEYNPYLKWFFKTDLFRQQISSGENTMINQITRYMLDDIALALPPTYLICEIVENLTQYNKNIKKLERVYRRKIACLDELKKSLLQQAFAGEL